MTLSEPCGVQVNKQRRALMFYLDLALKLKRTLVLPRIRLLRRVDGRPRNDLPARYQRWGDFFDVDALSKVHHVMELEEYLQLAPVQSLHVRIDHNGCPESAAVEVDFNGLAVHAAKSVCAAGMQYDAARLAAADTAQHESLAFSNSVDQLGLGPALKLRPYVRFVDSVYETAAEFTRRHFAGKPFLSIHWRRTDFLAVRKTQPGVLQSADDLVRHATRVMQQHGLEHVYLATDSDDMAELKIVEEALRPVRYTSQRSTLRQRTELANVEIAICAMAAHFLGTRTSSFTLAIAEERTAIFGHAPATATEMGMLQKMTAPKEEL